MIDKSEGAGLGLSIVGHIALLAILSLNLMSVREMPKLSEPMDVMLVDKAGLLSAAPEMSKEPPQAAQAPELGPVEEVPPDPTPTPPKPAPPSPPQPAPSPKPAPKVAPQKPVPPAAAAAKPTTATPAKPKAKATSLANDFLKGIPVEKSTGKAAAPRVAAISPIAMNGLIQAIQKKVKRCYQPPIGGADVLSIVSRINMRLKKDGSFAATPTVIGNTGVTGANERYVRQMNEAATRALQSCAPYSDLPADFYEGGWENINFNFRPNEM